MKTNEDHLYPEKIIEDLNKKNNNLENECKYLARSMWIFAFLFLFALVGYFYKLITSEQKIYELEKYQYAISDSIPEETFYQYNKQLCITDLMLSESFMPTVYKDAAGYNTIGFGHLIKPEDKIPDKIDFKTAYIILESDFNGAIAYARELGYMDDNTKQLAVAHAIFCLGIGNVNNIKDFKKDIVKYVYIRKPNGSMISSDHLLRSRQFEKNMYEKEL